MYYTRRASTPDGLVSDMKRGFALILSLSLMSFILILLLSLTTFIRIESQASSMQLKKLRAEQNALLGLSLGLGQLQRYAGPDTRVSTNAAILDIDPQTVEIEGVEHPHWVGFWDTTNSHYVPAFLVSGNEAYDLYQQTEYPENYLLPTTALEDPEASDETVYLNRSGTDSSQWVRIRRTEIKNEANRETYAYWVADEGIKAKVNIQTQQSSIYTTDRDYRASEFLLSGNDGASQLLETPVSEWESRITQRSDLEIIATDPSIVDDHFNDLTTYSYGLLTDTKHGGLRKDLSVAFEQDSIFNSLFVNNGQSSIVPINGTRSQGPNWHILKDYYNLYKQMNGSAFTPTIPSPTNSYNIGATLPGKPYADSVDDPYHTNNPVHPIISRMQYDFVLLRIPSTTELGKYHIRLGVRPCIALYNPYNINLSIADYYVDWKIVSSLTININSSSNDITYELDKFGLNGKNYQRARVRNVDLNAGETRLFYPLQSKEMSSSTVIDLGSKLNNEVGCYFELTTDGNPHGQVIQFEPDDQLRVVDVAFDQASYFTLKNNGLDTTNSYMRAHDFWPGSANHSIGPSIPPMSISSISGSSGGDLISSWLIYLRTAREAQQGIRNDIDTNFRFMVGSADFDLTWANGATLDLISPFSQLRTGAFQEAGNADPETIGNSRLTGFYGNSNKTGGQPAVILYDIPHSPIMSVGALQHANLGRYNHDPGHIIGNSYHNPRIALDQTESIHDGMIVYDLSYLINDKMWDSFFMSSIPPGITPGVVRDFINGKDALPNSRFIAHAPGKTPLTTGDFIISGETLDRYHELAAKLLLDGSFNINSTSVDAWKVFLSSISDLQVPVYNLNRGTVSQWVDEQAPIFSKFSRVGANSSDFWNGYVSLDQAQLDNLAVKIVELIKTRRRPVFSLSEFVNRSLTDYRSDTNTSDPRLSGLLQAALDHTATGINSDLRPSDSARVDADMIGTSNEQSTTFAGNLRQGDLLQSLGPFMTVRSDTFTIRSYGSTSDMNNNESTAYCEAVVQRFPESVQSNHQQAPNSLTAPHSYFGRQFRIIHFRWITKDET